MTKRDFLLALNDALGSMTGDERSAAIKYYSDYIDDAGPENLENVLQELGSPEQVAASILADADAAQQAVNGAAAAEASRTMPPPAPRAPGGMPVWAWILLICLLFPVWLPILATLGGLLVGAIGVGIGFFATTFALLICGVVLICVGIVTAFSAPPLGLLVMGVGCIGLSIGALFCMGCVFLCRTVIPATARFVGRVCSKIFRRRQPKTAQG